MKITFQQSRRGYASASSISDRASFPGYTGEFTTSLDFLYPENSQALAAYRVLNRKGGIISESNDPKVSRLPKTNSIDKHFPSRFGLNSIYHRLIETVRKKCAHQDVQDNVSHASIGFGHV